MKLCLVFLFSVVHSTTYIARVCFERVECLFMCCIRRNMLIDVGELELKVFVWFFLSLCLFEVAKVW